MLLFVACSRPVLRKIYSSRDRYILIRLDQLVSTNPKGRTPRPAEREAATHMPLGSPSWPRFGASGVERGFCTAVPGLQRQGREAVVSAFPPARKPRRAARLALLPQALSPRAQGRRHGVSPPNREAGSAAAREKRPLDPIQPTTGRLPSDSHREVPRNLTGSVPHLPHIIRVPPGELADILIHVLEALFGLF